LHTVYEQFATFESYPRFMTGVEQVIQVSSNETHWIMDLDGQRREFDAQITECSLDERVSWSTMTGPRLAETITLRPVGETRTQIVAQLEADAAFLLPHDRHAQESLNRRLKADLASFKRLIERDAAAGDRQLSGTGTILSGGASTKPARSPGAPTGPQTRKRPGTASPADVAARARRGRATDLSTGRDAAAGLPAPGPGGIGEAVSTRHGLPGGTHMGSAAMGRQAMSADDAWGDGMVNEEERGSAHDL
jgi:hypothetical protein